MTARTFLERCGIAAVVALAVFALAVALAMPSDDIPMADVYQEAR